MRPISKLAPPAVLCIAALLGIAATATMAEEPPKAKKPESLIVRAARDTAPSENILVITNELLEERYSLDAKVEGSVYSNADLQPIETAESATDAAAAPPAATPAPAPLEDPLVWMKKREQQARERQQRIQEAESALASARQRLADLEKQSLAVANPFAARPKLTEEEMKTRQESGESAAARHERTQAMVAQAREAVAAAEARLAQAYRQ